MPGKAYQRIYELALDQYGFFTAEQARKLGVSTQAIAKMRARGTIERQSWGLYRIPAIPPGEFGSYMQAVLWPQRIHGVISHETALDLFDVSDVNPFKTHITVPRAFRSRRPAPDHYVLHYADIESSEISLVEGVPVTSLARTIADCYTAHLGASLLLQAIEGGLKQGRLRAGAAEQLRRLVLGSSQH